jgi:glyoxylase-like metal-dependent hydrolase (beta-lactamase superfamily II)
VIFEQIETGGCQSYLVGCADTCAGALIDPELSQVDRYVALAARDSLRIRYLIDTHTHADHFSGTRELARRLAVPVVMHRASPAPFVDMRLDDGEMLVVGKLRLRVMHTPGHTRDSMCLVAADRVFTGDTLLIGGTGRTDLPSGDPEALHDSLFNKLLKLDPALEVYPAHDYKDQGHSTIAQELAANPRLQKRDRTEFVEMMRNLNLTMPTHLTEALRTNMSGGKTVAAPGRRRKDAFVTRRAAARVERGPLIVSCATRCLRGPHPERASRAGSSTARERDPPDPTPASSPARSAALDTRRATPRDGPPARGRWTAA